MLTIYMKTVCPNGDGKNHECYIENVDTSKDIYVYTFTCKLCGFTYRVPEHSLHPTERQLIKRYEREMEVVTNE